MQASVAPSWCASAVKPQTAARRASRASVTLSHASLGSASRLSSRPWQAARPAQNRRQQTRYTIRTAAGPKDDVVTITGAPYGDGMKFAIVTARFNSLVTGALLDGCIDTLLAHGVKPEDIVSTWVPGSFELGVVAKNMAASGKFAAVICLGAIIRGDTSHYDAVVSAATSGVQNAGSATGVPCIFGVLTTDNMDQALNRAGGKAGNIGSNAAATAIETSTLLSKLKSEGLAA
mmetsp:Transcript_32587/g.92385  ORF Transcript_32587/g.92385 Transcript_32587/m.92385 type:complete len:233 (+) Transcript_32587:121-819(+)|eukprot:CAMPEP_0117661536 /NCGR_PEP_ID=MMETSP0804-20121206/7589_1 /TAXON_ID=1074897 /ORGANISM="Tetraselmis astigmatica, Strain CCMP880" /LENGTH=232 /DNA_ID=CAMNT_0005468409 /DNA_START=328 /DNA_END=1026 /DNA_ORIENTATION=-